jgi:hypothetical protein
MTPGPDAPIDETSFAPEDKERVIEQLGRLRRPPAERRAIYAKWARLVGVTLTSEDMERISRDATS